MADIKAAFENAAQEVQSLPKKPDNDTLLQLYALYKQATAGDVRGSRPGMMDFVGQAKYDAWGKLRGTSREAAMKEYITLAAKLRKSS